eukprot:symbB.v1.2.020645.t1/scaffold1750.1/size103142/5
MMDYHGLSNMWPRELYSRALCVQEEQILEVIKLQEELKFHFYYTGLDPLDGTDDPKEYMCLVVYSQTNWKTIQQGLLQLGLEIGSAEEVVDKDTEDLAIQMMLRASDAWVTYCDPWMKREFADEGQVLKPGKVYRFTEDGLQEKLGL